MWKDILRLNVLLRGVAKCEIGNGTIICFSENLWQDGVLAQKYPRLATFAKQDSISVQEAMQAEELDTFFMLPLSVEALDELEPLHYKRKNLNGYQDWTLPSVPTDGGLDGDDGGDGRRDNSVPMSRRMMTSMPGNAQTPDRRTTTVTTSIPASTATNACMRVRLA